MRRDAEVELFPPGTLVRLPSGRVGCVQKSRGHESRGDYFIRIVIRIGRTKRHTVTLQPSLLRPFHFIE